MPNRTIYVINPVAEMNIAVFEAAAEAGCTEIARGIPERYAAHTSEVTFPFIITETNPALPPVVEEDAVIEEAAA